MSWVYLIGQDGAPEVKIGYASNPDNRLRTLQTSNPRCLTILWRTPGGRALESALHGHFRGLRVSGEWFDFGPMDAVEAVRKAAESHTPAEAAHPDVCDPVPFGFIGPDERDQIVQAAMNAGAASVTRLVSVTGLPRKRVMSSLARLKHP